MKGYSNVHVGFNSVLEGSENWTVGNNQVVSGNGVRMFGPAADPYFFRSSTEYNEKKAADNIVAFFDNFDPFTYEP